MKITNQNGRKALFWDCAAIIVAVQLTASAQTLVNRYSFSDADNGTGNIGASVADSVGGAAWNGTLPNGGTLAGGQLSLAAGSSQYVQLPAGILSNYTAVTIDAWATFGTLPVHCFFYGFGNTDGGGTGMDYIFCAPQGGRIAITATNWSGEQNAAGAGDLSYHTNLHVVAVYDPPAGYLALYTNGVLAAMNSAVTVPMSSVSSVLNYIGRSLYDADPYPDLSLDEFRIYNGPLQTDEIAATQILGPNQLLSTASPAISASASGGYLTLSWPLASAGCTVMTTTNLVGGLWTASAVTPQIIGNQWNVAVPVAENARFYRLQK